jgi:hypothetical protein
MAIDASPFCFANASLMLLYVVLTVQGAERMYVIAPIKLINFLIFRMDCRLTRDSIDIYSIANSNKRIRILPPIYYTNNVFL